MNNRVWIADSGSTKTDWCLCENGNVLSHFQSVGFNPFYQSEQEIHDVLSDQVLPHIGEFSSCPLYFYGAGIINDVKGALLKSVLHVFFTGIIETESDLLGAARALCGHDSGIACILGTGSNSCFYDGFKIKEHVSPLGFILGDEGSGAAIGKLFIGDLLKNQLPEKVKSDFFSFYKFSNVDIIDFVYRKSFPNRFLASFVPFIVSHIDCKEVYSIVYRSLRDFFTRNVMQYEYRRYPVHFTGSLAVLFKKIILSVANELDIQIGIIDASPMNGLIQFHRAL